MSTKNNKKSQWMIDFRTKSKLNQTEMADKLKVSRSLICNIENGKRNPSKNLIDKIGKVKKLDIKDLKTLLS